jgi:hypothetical protein
MSPENAKVIADFMAVNLANEYQTTRRVLAALPDDKLNYHPHEKAFTAAALAWHIATADVSGEDRMPSNRGRDCRLLRCEHAGAS